MQLIFVFLISLAGFSAHADSASFDWGFKNSIVTCGGTVDGEDLKMRLVTPDGLMSGESPNGRILVYIDLHKVGQVRWVISDALTDADYAKREASLAKLTQDEADQIRKLTATHETEIYMGMTNGFVTLRTATIKGQSTNLSCQEITNRNQGGMVGE